MTLKLKVGNGFISIPSAVASLPGDCRSSQWMFGWGRGKSFADCLEFAGLFLGTQSWVGFAALCLSPRVSSCFGAIVFKVPRRGCFFMEYPHF